MVHNYTDNKAISAILAGDVDGAELGNNPYQDEEFAVNFYCTFKVYENTVFPPPFPITPAVGHRQLPPPSLMQKNTIYHLFDRVQ